MYTFFYSGIYTLIQTYLSLIFLEYGLCLNFSKDHTNSDHFKGTSGRVLSSVVSAIYKNLV